MILLLLLLLPLQSAPSRLKGSGPGRICRSIKANKHTYIHTINQQGMKDTNVDNREDRTGQDKSGRV